MATTFDRLQIALQHIKDNHSVSNKTNIAKAIRGRRLGEFKLRGQGASIKDFMSVESIERLIQLLNDLTLVTIDSSKDVTISSAGITALGSDAAFSNKVDSATKTLLARKGVPLSDIGTAIKSIAYPDIPDTGTIYGRLELSDMTLDDFKRLMFLLSCADGITRQIHVCYKI